MGALVELTRRTVGFMVVQGKARWDNTNRQTQRVGRVDPRHVLDPVSSPYIR